MACPSASPEAEPASARRGPAGAEALVRVIGIGNPLMGDDAVGPRVVEALSKAPLPEGVAVVDGGTGGLSLLDLMDGAHQAIFVDAVEFGGTPGEIAVFRPDDVRRMDLAPIASLHGIGLLEALELGESLGLGLPEITIVGVQPDAVELGEGLSPAVQACLPDVTATVLDLLARNLAQGDTGDG
jgi:hydrogenase maturation protease